MKKIFAIAVLFFSAVCNVSAQNNAASDLIDEGIKLYDQGKYKEAIEKYKASYLLDSNSIVLFSEMSMTYLALKEYATTEMLCRQAIAKFPDNKLLKNIYSNYGNSLDEEKKPEEAIKIYGEGLSKFPNDYLLYFNKGITEYGLKRNYDARASFQNALKLNPKHSSSWYYLGIIEDDFGNRIPAILCFSRFLVLQPKGDRAEKTVPYLTDKVNNMFYQSTSGKTTATYSSAGTRTDTVESTFAKVEENLTMLAVTSSIPGMEKEGQTALEKFETHEQSIFELLKAYKKGNTDFYWTYVAPYFIELEEKGFVKTYTYYINYYVTGNKTVEKWMEKNPKQVNGFLDWSYEFKW